MSGDKDQPDGDDAALFREAMDDVQRLRDDRAEPHRRRRRPQPIEHAEEDPADQLGDLSIETGDFLDYRVPGVQHRVYQDLRRGVMAPQASLDLHGLRVAAARTVFSRFLQQSLARGYRCVRIIHGKGRGSGDGQPVLKQKTNQWLRQIPEVLAFTTAPRWDGGTGAVYVLLSRKHATPPYPPLP